MTHMSNAVQSLYLVKLLTSNPIALSSWETEMFNVTPRCNGIISYDWLSTLSRTTPPDVLLPNILTVGGRLQGMIVTVTTLT